MRGPWPSWPGIPRQIPTVALRPVLDNILRYLDELLTPSSFQDYGPNGLQVPGPPDVQTMVTGVSASAELFERAAELGADLVIVHHGLFWSGAPLALTASAKRRLQLLFEHDIGLAAYHLPLDGHQQVGNNALLAAGLGLPGPRAVRAAPRSARSASRRASRATGRRPPSSSSA